MQRPWLGAVAGVLLAIVMGLVACEDRPSNREAPTRAVSPTPSIAATKGSQESESGGLPDSELATLEAELNTTDMSISMHRGPEPVVAGGEIAYQVAIMNRGPNPASDVIVTIEFSGSELVQVSSADCTDVSEQRVSCSPGEIPARVEVDIEFVVRSLADESSTIKILATVQNAAGPDPDPTNNQTSDEVAVPTSP